MSTMLASLIHLCKNHVEAIGACSWLKDSVLHVFLSDAQLCCIWQLWGLSRHGVEEKQSEVDAEPLSMCVVYHPYGIVLCTVRTHESSTCAPPAQMRHRVLVPIGWE